MPAKNIIPGQRVAKEKLERARELRREMTSASPSHLPCGHATQSPKSDEHNLEFAFNLYVVVFGGGAPLEAGAEGVKAGLVIELDGSVHEENVQRERDINRDKTLTELGLRVIRFRNEEVLTDLSQVVGKIQELISSQ